MAWALSSFCFSFESITQSANCGKPSQEGKVVPGKNTPLWKWTFIPDPCYGEERTSVWYEMLWFTPVNSHPSQWGWHVALISHQWIHLVSISFLMVGTINVLFWNLSVWITLSASIKFISFSFLYKILLFSPVSSYWYKMLPILNCLCSLTGSDMEINKQHLEQGQQQPYYILVWDLGPQDTKCRSSGQPKEKLLLRYSSLVADSPTPCGLMLALVL